METEELTLEEFVEEINEEIREKFNKLERRVYGFTGLVLGSLSLSPLLFTFILKDKFKLGIGIYILGVLLFQITFKLIHKKIYGKLLEYDYQWGNTSFENIEIKTLNGMYKKEIIDDEEYDCYNNMYAREVIDEDYIEYKVYKRRVLKFNIILTILTLVPCLLLAIKTVKSL